MAGWGSHIILTGSPDMISPDQNARDGLVMALEKAGYVVHHLSTPCHTRSLVQTILCTCTPRARLH
jgi:hypothetical protein